MASISTQEYQSFLSELQCLKEKFVALEQENQHLLGDLQQITIEKQQHIMSDIKLGDIMSTTT